MTAWRDTRDELESKVTRLRRARATRRSPWRTALRAGALGWILVLPVVLGGIGGRHFGQRMGASWLGAAGVVFGLLLGAYGVWHTVRRTIDDTEEIG